MCFTATASPKPNSGLFFFGFRAYCVWGWGFLGGHPPPQGGCGCCVGWGCWWFYGGRRRYFLCVVGVFSVRLGGGRGACVSFGGLLLFLFYRVLLCVLGVSVWGGGCCVCIYVCASGALLCGLLVWCGSIHTSAFTTRRVAFVPVRGTWSKVRPRGTSNVQRAEGTCAVAFSSPTCAVRLLHILLLLP